MSISDLFTERERFERIEQHFRETFGGFDNESIHRRIHHNADDETREMLDHDPTLFIRIDDLAEAREVIDELESMDMDVTTIEVEIRAKER